MTTDDRSVPHAGGADSANQLPWHTLEVGRALDTLGVAAGVGLSGDDAVRRLQSHGPNALVERGGRSPWAIVWEQLTAAMVLILIAAAVISAALGDWKDTIAIVAIVLINGVIGFRQEYRAEKAMAALKRLSVPTVRVIRDGEVREIPSTELVPGDLVQLEAGNVIPADCRLVEAVNLRTQEAALTGESEAVEKTADVLADEGLAVADRRNMVFMGTVAVYGRGTALVTATGMGTELGAIAEMIQSVDTEPTPLQKRMDQLGKWLAGAAGVIVAIVFAEGLLRGEGIKVMFLTAVSMAVAAVPEGLPAVVTITLAFGAMRMLRRNALIRKLPAVETLGSVTTICSDKTGTLTENRMTVTILDVAGHRLDLQERLRRDGAFLAADEARAVPEAADAEMAMLLAAGALCNDARLTGVPGATGEFEAIGDPTEGALVVAAARSGFVKPTLERIMPRIWELPFDSERKRMTTVHRIPGGADGAAAVIAAIAGTAGPGSHLALVKGAVDGLVERSATVLERSVPVPMDEGWRARIQTANDDLAGKGMRVLGFAFRLLDGAPKEGDDPERDLIFVGMAGMLDPVRPEVTEAVAVCKRAGIRPVMITGDHPLTASHIAAELGIADGGRIMTGRDLDGLSLEEFERVVEEVNVYARVSPEHKLTIVTALQDKGEVVAMTGDGVNDAPALKRADIGVAMGITGTDVSKEAADMVLRDDNFSTIVAAVEEGRVIYDNIRKFIKYMLTSNSGELWVMFLAPFLGMPLPLLPLQILWINLMTDGLPALALGVEPAERATMLRPPRRSGESIFSEGMGAHIVWVGLLMGITSLGIGWWYWRGDEGHWQTMLFTTLTLAQMSHLLAIRSWKESLFTQGIFTNKPLVAAVALTYAMQVAVIYLPFLQGIFRTQPLTAGEFILCLAVSAAIFVAVEIEKWVKRQRERRR